MGQTESMNLQAALPFKNQSEFDFETWLGDSPVAKALQKYDELPQFTYLHGQNHTGKTHLLNALQQSLHNQGIIQQLIQAKSLQQLDITAIIPNGIKYILVDDINELTGKPEGELALFNFFNHCKNHQIKLIVSSCIEPKSDLWKLPDLVSRINSGLTLRLQPLKGDSAFQCLAQQFEFNGIPVETAVIQYLQTHHNSSYPRLYQLFLSVAAESLQKKRKVTVPLVKTVIVKQSATDSLS